MKHARVIESGKMYGNMNTSANFYPDGMTAEARAKDFLSRRQQMGEFFGFDGAKMFMADQKKKNGSFFEITPDFVEAYPNGWADIPEDILVITNEVPKVVIGHPVADCPVVMMEDPINGVSAIAHCSAAFINDRLPMMLADALTEYGSRDEDIITYVSACAGSGWTYDKWPGWATDSDLWNGAIFEENGIFRIDLRNAIAKQLAERNIDLGKTIFNLDDTITNPNYFSNCASSPRGGNDASKAGRHFAGLYYPERGKVLMKK